MSQATMSDDGSDDSPPRPKRRIKKVLVMSSESSSDSDESIGATGTRRKRLRVVSDAESNSSGSSVVRAGTRHRRTLPKLRDSDADSDSSTGGPTHAEPKPPPTSKPTSGFASDSSEGNSDKCSICLLRFTDQEVGTPETCEHIFCLDCITEWSKNVNTCPVDRITFNSIVVRVCAGGRVLRTEPVKVVERRSSVDLFVVEDPTVCEVCGSTDNEETMLLCDGCDLGYHMQCLVPPLSEVPIDQWLCPNCDDLLDVIHLSEVDDLFSGIVDLDLPIGPRPVPLREPRNVRRSSRNVSNQDEPSTSSGQRGTTVEELPTTSRSSRVSHNSASSRSTTRRRATGTQRRRTTKRRSKTVVIEYEVQENGKFPVTKRITRRVKKRKTKKRQPRTAARRSHVRASVRARLQDLREARAAPAAPPTPAGAGLSAARRHAGIPALSLFGERDQLEYFSEDEGVSEGATTAVVARPTTSSIISAYRQARRKMISIPSPPHAAAAPDLLSGILESQTLLHSKKSVISVSVDGNVNIKLATTDKNGFKRPQTEKKDDKVDLSKGEDTSRKAPSYPGQSRGGGGWGGGYRGTYNREQTGNFRSGYEGYQPGHAPRAPGAGYQHAARRDDDAFGDFPRRAPPYLHDDEFERRRSLPDGARPGYPHNQRPPDQPRFGAGNSWQPYGPPQRSEPPLARHSFGGFENPLDMRTGAAPYRPLPEPPAFKFGGRAERDDDGGALVIDTDKYDPTDPTNDDSGDDASTDAAPAPPAPAEPDQPAPQLAPLPAPPALPPAMQSILAGLDRSVPPGVLDTAVRQVLQEHRGLLAAPAPPRTQPASDDDDDGDCPNFSIYSATSVHIANSTGVAPAPAPPARPDDMSDLVQEDDDTAPDATPEPDNSSQGEPVADLTPIKQNDEIKKKEDEYKEKVSKRCPITTNTRNPIKIKLNTPSLIKRRVSLYDEDEPAADDEPAPQPACPQGSPPAGAAPDDKTSDDSKHIEQDQEAESDSEQPMEQEPSDDAAPTDVTQDKNDERQTPDKEEAVATTESSDEDAEDKDAVEAFVNGDGDKTPDLDKDKDEDLDKEDGEEEAANSEAEPHSEDDTSDRELGEKRCRDQDADPETNEDGIEKMTESISETEDERSYTPCLDENKSKDTSLETEKDKNLEGLDTEMISEDEGNEMFSDQEKAFSEQDKASSRATPPPARDHEDGELSDKKKDKDDARDDAKKKKKKESKKDGKDKSKSKKKGDIAFKKLSKSGKERNYREREKEGKKKKETDAEKKKRKEKRKDLERYDVRTVVSEKRRKLKDAFGRDVSPRRSRSASPAPSHEPARRPSRPRRSLSRVRRSLSRPRRSLSRARRSLSRARRSLSRARASLSPARPRLRRSPSLRRSMSRPRRSLSRARLSLTPRSATPRASPSPRRRSAGPARRRRRSGSRARRTSPRRRRSGSRGRKRRRSASKSPSPKVKSGKRRRRARSERAESRRRSPRRKSPRRKRARRRSGVRGASPAAAPTGWSPASLESRLLSPRTPPPEALPAEPLTPRRLRESPRPRHRRNRDNTGPSKEVFTSGDNILVSVSFKDQERSRSSASAERARRARRRDKRRRRRRAEPAAAAPRPVAIIDLERSPFRELTPEPRDVIVLSDSDHGKEHTEKEAPAAAPAAPEPAVASGPKTPPSPSEPAAPPAPAPAPAAASPRGPATPMSPPSSPDAYDPFEPTRSPSPAPRAMTLETAQKTNMSADEVIDRRPLSPMEKVLQLLQSTRDAPPSPPPGAPGAGPPGPAPHAEPAPPPAAAPAPPPAAPRIVLPEPAKLFLAKPSPIKSDPIKPMQATKISRLPLPRRADESPYSPGSSDFGELFEPRPAARKRRPSPKLGKRSKKGKLQVGVKIDEDKLKVLDELPSSAVEMQVKTKFLKKLNRQERVVEEVKLVLKPHYNKKHVSKDEYKDILRRAVPKICHNKSGEINPTKIQALVEAYVKKFRKKRKQPAA